MQSHFGISAQIAATASLLVVFFLQKPYLGNDNVAKIDVLAKYSVADYLEIKDSYETKDTTAGFVFDNLTNRKPISWDEGDKIASILVPHQIVHEKEDQAENISSPVAPAQIGSLSIDYSKQAFTELSQPDQGPDIDDVLTKSDEGFTDEVSNLIAKYASEFGISYDTMVKIAKCESGFRAAAASPSGAYVGIYQFSASTWVSNRNAMGLDPNPSLRSNMEEAVKTAAFKMSNDGFGAWPICGEAA